MRYPIWRARRLNFDPADLVREIGCGRLLGTVAAGRFETCDAAISFMTSYTHVAPYSISGMREAVQLTMKHLKNGSRVLVYGDYDADGVCSAAVVYKYLRSLGSDVDFLLSVRKDGYGFKEKAIDKALAEDRRLIIALDCGTNDIEVCEKAKGVGIDVIVIDHHEPLSGRPPAAALVNPKYYGDRDNYYCAAGLALKFVEGLALSTGKDIEHDLYVLAAVATVADVCDLIGENRYIVSKGIELWNASEAPWIKALKKSAGVSRATATLFGFAIGPRLNAPGRLSTPHDAFRLLIAESDDEAAEFAAAINRLNQERQDATDSAEAVALAKIKVDKDTRIIVVADESLEHGIAGIVAGKISRRFSLPAIVFSEEGNMLKGSGRAPDGYDLVDMLSKVKEYITVYGGHKAAVGVTIEKGRLHDFVDALNRVAPPPAPAVYDIDAILNADEAITPDDIAELALLEPFGRGNPVPVFLMRGIKPAYSARTADGKHIRMKVGNLWAVWFDGARYYDNIQQPLDIALELSINEYNGRRDVQGIVKAAAPSVTLTRQSLELVYTAVAAGDYEGIDSELGWAKYPAIQALLELGVIATEDGRPIIVPVEGKKDLNTSCIYAAYAS